jgi:hypothetical protein
MAKSTKVQPTHMTGTKPLKVALHDVVRAFQVIEEHKLTAKFVKAAKEKGAFVSVGADTVNFVKDFFADNGLHEHPIGKHIINAQPKPAAAAAMAAAAPSQDFDCNFGTH